MPSLADSLAQLAQQSEQIHSLSLLNAAPAGPFVQTYLHPSNSRSAFHTTLIRDASEAEVRSFKFIGENEGIKRVEKRDDIGTPLNNLDKGKVKGKGEVEAVLRTAAKLVDDYRPMPRARSHIASLLDAHEKLQARMIDLERLISEAANPNAPRSAPNMQSPSRSRQAKAPLSADEAIKAEEETLRALEAMIAPHRRPVQDENLDTSSSRAPTSPPLTASRGLGNSTNIPVSPPIRAPQPGLQTPAKTPAPSYPHVANSLVNGTTPFKSAQQQHRINRFSPLKLIGTPREAENSHGQRQSIFGFGRSSVKKRALSASQRSAIVPAEEGRDRDQDADVGPSSPSKVVSDVGVDQTLHPGSDAQSPTEERDDGVDEEDHDAMDAENETIRLAPPPAAAELPLDDVTPTASPVKQASPQKGPLVIEGIPVESEAVQAAVAKIWSSYADLLKHGVPVDKVMSESPEDTIRHLYRLSISNPDPPPSPSSSSVSSASTAPAASQKPVPITREAIFQAYLCLLLLRAPDQVIPMSEVKEDMGATIRARKWDVPDDFATSVIYKVVGKKAMRIDRRGGPGGVLRFNV